MDVLEREIKGLQGDLNMTHMAVNSVQNDMLAQLKGDMGKDMDAVLNGEKFVSVSKTVKRKHKIKHWFRNFFQYI